jgi:hypothetical protein
MTKYRVERSVKSANGVVFTNYAILSSGEGELVHGDDPVLLYKIADLLNGDDVGEKILSTTSGKEHGRLHR